MQGDPWNWPDLQSGGALGGWGISTLAGTPQKDTKGSIFNHLIDSLIERIAPCPWSATTGSAAALHKQAAAMPKPLYTPQERQRRDSTAWTLVQGILAPIQFLVFLVSLGLVLNYLVTASGYQAATMSVIVKTLVLYTIMITGAIWEKTVFGRYLFAPAFFWEDAVSMLVIALHTAYVLAVCYDWGSPQNRMILALAAYATYALNATQFLIKLRAARLQAPAPHAQGGAR
jgi:3-vinyl bacteriochlorophyllide hydratase